MASFGLEPFDDDDAIDWLFSLSAGEFDKIHQQLKGSPKDRKTWAAFGLVAAIYDTKITLPNGQSHWRSNKQDVPDKLLLTALSGLSKVLDSVNRQVEHDNLVHTMAVEEWQRIAAAINTPLNVLKEMTSEDEGASIDADSGFVCAFCSDTISTKQLIVMTLSKNGPVEIDLQCHDNCLAQHLQNDLHLLLNNL